MNKGTIHLFFLLLGSCFAIPKSMSDAGPDPEGKPYADPAPKAEPESEAESDAQWGGGGGWNLEGGSGIDTGGTVDSGYHQGGGDSGFHQGGGGSSYHPGGGGSGWNGGDSGYNQGGGDSGWDGGDSGFNQGGDWGGGGGYIPGGGGSGYNPGGGGSGYNPGGGGFITPVYDTSHTLGDVSGGSGYVSGGSGYGQGGYGGQGGQGGCASDQCCGMADNNCCLGGKQCYTYYEQQCKRVDKPRCQIESSEFCKTRRIPMCRVVRVPDQATITVESCAKRPKRQCFTYQREICNTFPEPHMHNVTWTNDKLEETETESLEECKTVDACEIKQEVKVEERVVDKQVCNETKTEQKEQCTIEYEQGAERTIKQTQFKIDYQQRCFNVPRQICDSNSCTSGGCVDGGSVCSANDYTYQQRCATQVGGAQRAPSSCGSQGVAGQGASCGSGGGSVCQKVKEAACYGPSASCAAPAQQCCRIVQQKVCQQVPVRVPVPVDVTVPGQMIPKRKCETVDVESPVCKTYQETVQEEKTYDKCEMSKKEQCVTFEIPSFSIVKAQRSEQVELRVNKCKKSVVSQEYCHVFADAAVDCRQRRETRRYILNKVVCDRQRDAKICRSLPWSRCMAGSGQECEMVARQRCVDSCSNNPACGKCDQMRQAGALQGGCGAGLGTQGAPLASAPSSLPAPSSVPASASCGNYYPKDLVGTFAPASGSTAFHAGTSNTAYPQVTSQDFVPASTLPHGGASLGYGGASLPEIGDRDI